MGAGTRGASDTGKALRREQHTGFLRPRFLSFHVAPAEPRKAAVHANHGNLAPLNEPLHGAAVAAELRDELNYRQQFGFGIFERGHVLAGRVKVPESRTSRWAHRAQRAERFADAGSAGFACRMR